MCFLSGIGNAYLAHRVSGSEYGHRQYPWETFADFVDRPGPAWSAGYPGEEASCRRNTSDPEGQPTEKPKTTKEATPDTAKKPADKSQETKKPAEATAPPAPAKKKEIPLHLAKGKKRAAGAMPPTEKQEQPVQAQLEAPSATFTVSRDPFKAPTEILPSECPPSMPLCKFDFSQLKLVGVIQVEQGQFKGMVEDPDGRGYFITPGMQIGGATVTQVTNKGIILHVRKTRQDVNMPLFLEAKESQDF